MPDHSLCKEFLSNIQPKFPLAEFKPMPPCPIADCLGEETNPHLARTALQVVLESAELTSKPPLLQTK